MSQDDDERKALVFGLRSVRQGARDAPRERVEAPPSKAESPAPSPLAPTTLPAEPAAPTSPEREDLNSLWDLLSVRDGPRPGGLRGLLARAVHSVLGPLLERQTSMNAAQVRFDNEIVAYVDERLDRQSRHYDSVLGAHGKRMEEIDERHLILQQELVRHVHDLVERIEFVFETAETNHLYLEGLLRELREELEHLRKSVETLLDQQARATPPETE